MSSYINNLFTSFNQTQIMVIGDVMIDSYLWGKVDRISPEAPVPVLSVQKKEDRLGGAANVALNLQSMGAVPIVCTTIGDDANGKLLTDLFIQQSISTEGIVRDINRSTTVKTRAIAHHQHLMRIDDESDAELTKAQTQTLLERIQKLLEQHTIEAIIFEDYDKGVINPELITFVVSEAKKRSIPVVVDPKKRNFLAYKGVTLFKPNLKELKEGLKIEFDHTQPEHLRAAAKQLKEKLQADMVMITLSEHGVFIINDKEYHHIPAHIRNISDVSGAGDTVISIATLGLAKKTPAIFFAALANLAGGLVCEKVGVVPIDKMQLQQEALLLDDPAEI